MFANTRPGGGVWAENPKLSVCGSVSGVPCEMATQGDGGRWWVQVGNMEAAGVLRVHQREARGRGLSQKSENRAFVARFRACCVKLRSGVMLGGGGCALTTWRRRWGCAFANARPGGGG